MSLIFSHDTGRYFDHFQSQAGRTSKDRRNEFVTYYMYIMIITIPICFKLSFVFAMVLSLEVISLSRLSIMRS